MQIFDVICGGLPTTLKDLFVAVRRITLRRNAPILSVNRWVAGSNPARGAIFSRGFKVNPSLYKSSGVQLGHRWPALQGTHACGAGSQPNYRAHFARHQTVVPPSTLIIVARLLAGLQAVEAPACSAD